MTSQTEREHYKLLLKRVRQQFICVYLRPSLPICRWNIYNWEIGWQRVHRYLVFPFCRRRRHRRTPHTNSFTLIGNENFLIVAPYTFKVVVTVGKKKPRYTNGWQVPRYSRDKMKSSEKSEEWIKTSASRFSRYGVECAWCSPRTTTQCSVHCSIPLMQSTWTWAGVVWLSSSYCEWQRRITLHFFRRTTNRPEEQSVELNKRRKFRRTGKWHNKVVKHILQRKSRILNWEEMRASERGKRTFFGDSSILWILYCNGNDKKVAALIQFFYRKAIFAFSMLARRTANHTQTCFCYAEEF